MITRVLLEFIGNGQLPVYDIEWVPNPNIEAWRVFHVLDFEDPLAQYEMDGHWRAVHGQPRIIIPLTIDTDLIECQRQVPRWIEEAQQIPGDGTLIFCLHTSAPTLGTGAHYVCAGMAYVPQDVGAATILQGEDPTELVLHVLQGHRDHPLVQAVLDRREAEIREHARYWIMAEAARAVERKKQHAAYKRAARLLNSFLTPKQKRELRKKNHIHVNGQDGQLYRIEARSHQNVFLIKDGKPVTQFCVVSREILPVPDLVLAQKLLLEANIAEFMALANKWEVHERRPRERIDPVVEAEFQAEIRQILQGEYRRRQIQPVPVWEPPPFFQ
jgi:hypothetical protein